VSCQRRRGRRRCTISATELQLEGTKMAWIIKLTEVGGQNVYVNLDQVVSFEPCRWEKGEGTRLRTTLVDKEGLSVDLTVQESADKVYEKMLASR
jgi:hypothetical protein